ncbi:YdcF family protein [uncultured Microscilla sp.]|uniref:YdcF family protein n=1 Tax=uncultured Microscilla sp. TaxID=432653 RepID=UPI00262F97CD|nr:YdcF family protein [uncultured Microscilla sp.]
MPVTWLCLVFTWALLTKKSRRKRQLLRTGVFLLWLFTNPFIVNQALLLWEAPPTPLHSIRQTYDVGIVLTGVTNTDKKPHDRVYLDKGGDRITQALMLYRLGKIKKILISGGSFDPKQRLERAEAYLLKQVLLQAKVPSHDIIIETRARNTRENALNTAKILNKQFPRQSYLLITSAFHIRRAVGCFRQASIQVTPFSVDFYTIDKGFAFPFSLFPAEKALYKWYVLSHEVIGYIVYKALGYA